MAELADALDSGSSEHYAHASSSLVIRITIWKSQSVYSGIFVFIFYSIQPLPLLLYNSYNFLYGSVYFCDTLDTLPKHFALSLFTLNFSNTL